MKPRRVQELRARIANFDSNRGPILEAAKKRLAAARMALEAAKVAHTEAEEAAGAKAADHECAADEREELAKQLAAAETARNDAKVCVY